MTHPQENLKELASLTKRYLIQEHDRGDWIMTDSTTYNFFKGYALQKRTTPPTAAITPKPTIVPPPQVASPKKPLPPKAPPPPKEIAQPAPKSDPVFTLAPPPAKPTDDFADIREVLATKVPHQTILEAPPDDSNAKQIRQQWKDRHKEPEIVILDISQSPQQRAFLRNLTTALDLCLGPARLISAEDPRRDHPKLRLVLGPQGSENSTAQHLELGNLDRFFQDPQQKAEFWKTLSAFRNHG